MLTRIPKDSHQAKYFLRNSSDTVVNISIRRAPVHGNSATIEIAKGLHGPAELSNDLLVGKSCHCKKWLKN